MATFPGSLKLVKAGFVQLDAMTGAVQRILVFQYNPETLVRRLEGVTAVPPPGVPAAPRETVAFTLVLDATDKLQAGDPATQQTGLLPIISELELLLYPAVRPTPKPSVLSLIHI